MCYNTNKYVNAMVLSKNFSKWVKVWKDNILGGHLHCRRSFYRDDETTAAASSYWRWDQTPRGGLQIPVDYTHVCMYVHMYVCMRIQQVCMYDVCKYLYVFVRIMESCDYNTSPQLVATVTIDLVEELEEFADRILSYGQLLQKLIANFASQLRCRFRLNIS